MYKGTSPNRPNITDIDFLHLNDNNTLLPLTVSLSEEKNADTHIERKCVPTLHPLSDACIVIKQNHPPSFAHGSVEQARGDRRPHPRRR